MNSHELLKRVETMTAALGRAKPLIERLQEFVKQCGGIEEQMGAAVGAGDPNAAFQASQHARNKLLSAINGFKSGSASIVYRALDELQTGARSFAGVSSGMGELWLPRITSQLENVRDSLDRFVDQSKVADAISFMHAAIELNSLLQVEQAFLRSLHLQLTNLPVSIPEGRQSLSLFFEIDIDPIGLALRLEAVQLLYSEVCKLTNVPEAEYPLQVAKLEVGSIWTVLVGKASVITFVAWMIKAGLGYMHRNFTIEGRISAIPRQGEALKSVIDIKKQLEKAGLDTSQMDPQIQRSGAAIAVNLTRLLEGIPVAEVDGDQISVGTNYTEKLIEAHRQKLLPCAGDINPDSSESKLGGTNQDTPSGNQGRQLEI